MTSTQARILESAEAVLARTALRARVGLVLGSGLGSLVDRMADVETIPYALLPNFPQPTVEGHHGDLALGKLGGRVVAALRGRIHLYEGYRDFDLAFPIRLLRALGCDTLIVTNAAGAVAPELRTGDLMLINDHIYLPGLAGINPLVGPVDPQWGPRFVDMKGAYDQYLRTQAKMVANELGIPLREGVYVMVAGPNYETPAELRLLRTLGADAVGMSTCPEVVVARQAGMRVIGLSVITNSPELEEHDDLNHLQVVAVAESVVPRLSMLVEGLLQTLGP